MAESNKMKDMPVNKLMVQMGIPMILSMALQAVYNIVDSAFVGNMTSYGTCLRVLHTDGSESLYAHLQYAYVRPGEVVEAGQLLGAAGRSGRATGAHLHFELYRQGTACDPADALGLSS